jgi:predicted RNase H-like HicB family nuclease
MLSTFIKAAMKKARYEILEDGQFYGEIEICPGVWANDDTLEGCRETLQEVLEEWLILKLRDRDPLPVIAGVDLLAKAA